MEAQMTDDEDIIFRVFEYAFGHASRNSIKENGNYILPFPEVRIIYLYSENVVPDEYTLTLDFGSQGTYDYRVSTFKFQENSIEEINKRKLIILIPFTLLKLRKEMKKERKKENLEALKKLIQNDIIGSINENLKQGNLTADDGKRLLRLTHKLYEHIYAHYEELEELSEMTDESLILDVDIWIKERDEEIERVTAEVTEKVTEEVTAKVTAEVTAKKDAEIEALKKQFAESFGS